MLLTSMFPLQPCVKTAPQSHPWTLLPPGNTQAVIHNTIFISSWKRDMVRHHLAQHSYQLPIFIITDDAKLVGFNPKEDSEGFIQW